MPFAEIVRSVATGAHAVLVLDGAGWHGGHALVVPDNIFLVLLSPYSPELNPVENVWQYLRANWIAISVFDDYQAIDGAPLWWTALLGGTLINPLGFPLAVCFKPSRRGGL